MLDLIATLPNDPAIIQRFLRALSISQLLQVCNIIPEFPYYVGRQFLRKTKMKSEIYLEFIGTKFLARLDSNYVSRFSKESNESYFRKRLPLLFPAIGAILISPLWKGIQKKLRKLIEDSSKNLSDEHANIIKRIFSYASFKQWIILNRVEEQESFKKIIPESTKYHPFFEDRLWREFKIFCMIMEEFLRYKPFQEPIKEAATQEEKVVLDEIFNLLKVRSLVETCIDAIRDKKIPYLEDSLQLPSDLVEQFNLAHFNE